MSASIDIRYFLNFSVQWSSIGEWVRFDKSDRRAKYVLQQRDCLRVHKGDEQYRELDESSRISHDITNIVRIKLKTSM